MKRCLYLILWGLLSGYVCTAQIRVIPTKIDDWVKKNFSGQGVVIGNVKHTGSQQAIASYTSSANVLQVQKGLILSTGYASGVSGVNNHYNHTKAFVDMRTPQSDQDLAKLITEKLLYDVCVIEFDFVPLANSLQFNYQFGSDEYPEWVDKGYNDVFAFLVSDETSNKNIALVPGASIPISINTINFKTNSNYFIDNNVFSQVIIKGARLVPKPAYRGSFPGRIWHGIKKFFSSAPEPAFDRQVTIPDPELLKKVNPALYRNLQYDGITTKMVAQTYVEPYKKYHFKIIIADVGDNMYDSGVFIEDHSFTAKRDTLQPGFVDFPDYSKVINAQLILDGKKLADILPAPKAVAAKPVATVTVAQQKIAEAKAEEAKLAAENVTVYFDFDKTVITPVEMTKLKKMSEIYGKLKDNYNIRITGHTDSIGGLDYNLNLSKRRDQAVIDSLRKLITGTTFNVLSVTERAYLQPAADNSTDEGRTRNRRVEIIFIRKE